MILIFSWLQSRLNDTTKYLFACLYFAFQTGLQRRKKEERKKEGRKRDRRKERREKWSKSLGSKNTDIYVILPVIGGTYTSLTQWTWVWVNSGSWWWTRRPGVWQSRSCRVRHDWATELNWGDSFKKTMFPILNPPSSSLPVPSL